MRIRVRIAEKQIAAVANPDGAFGELKSFGQLEDLRIRTDDRIDRRVEADDFDVDLARRDRHRVRAPRDRNRGVQNASR